MRIIESYKHKIAKLLLARWLRSEYETRTEVKFYSGHRILFIADIVCYDRNEPFAIYEITHKHGIDFLKLSRIQQWSYRNSLQLQVYEVQAEWILSQIRKPDRLKYIEYTNHENRHQ